jgi:hypothetical protein
MAKHTQKAVAAIMPDEFQTKRIDGIDTRYLPLEYRGKTYELREMRVDQAQRVTELYADIGFLRASGLTGAGEADLDGLFGRLGQPAYMAKWLSIVLVHEDGTECTEAEFLGGLQKQLTPLYREAFQSFFTLNPSIFENFGLGLAMGLLAGTLRSSLQTLPRTA